MDKRINNLHKKYMDDTIHPEEFDILKEDVIHATDEELEGVLHNSWENSKNNKPYINKESQSRILERIHNSINVEFKNHIIKRFKKFYQYAAMLFLPLLLFSTIYFYVNKNNTTHLMNDIVVKTHNKQNVSISLPDGTSVVLNENSMLTYNPQYFNGKHRVIELIGEAYLEVKKDTLAPFYIETKDCQLKVLGTKFNFKSNEKDSCIKVALLEGGIMLESKSNHSVQIIKPGEEAIYNKNKGTFDVKVLANINNQIAWISGILTFKQEPLYSVIKQMQEFFGVDIKVKDIDKHLDESFTGSLPTDNIEEAIKIVEYSLK